MQHSLNASHGSDTITADRGRGSDSCESSRQAHETAGSAAAELRLQA